MGNWTSAAEKASDQIYGAYQSKHAERNANTQAKDNRNWQEYMSNTAVQRRMEDMRLAGINPLLAGKYDASTPGGSALAVGTHTGSPINATATASQASLNLSQEDKIKWEIENLVDQGFINEQTSLLLMEQVKEMYEKVKIANETHNGLKLDNEMKRLETEAYTDLIELMSTEEQGVAPSWAKEAATRLIQLIIK